MQLKNTEIQESGLNGPNTAIHHRS